MKHKLSTAALAACVAALILGFGLVAAALPSTTTVLSRMHSQAGLAGLETKRMVEVAREVHGFTVFGRPSVLPEQVDGRSGFDPSAVSHLEDVRNVLRAAFAALVVVVGAAAVLTRLLLRAGRRAAVGRALLTGGAGLLVFATGVAIWAAADFDTFFVVFHSLFFVEGTWLFDPSSLLILLFPEAFWVGMGVVWALASAALAAMCIVGGMLLSRNRPSQGRPALGAR